WGGGGGRRGRRCTGGFDVQRRRRVGSPDGCGRHNGRGYGGGGGNRQRDGHGGPDLDGIHRRDERHQQRRRYRRGVQGCLLRGQPEELCRGGRDGGRDLLHPLA